MSLSITATKTRPISAAMDKPRDIASRASVSIAGDASDGISVVRSLPWYLIVIANLVKGAARAAGCDTSFCSCTCATPTEPSLTSAVWREPLDKIIRRKLIPSLEHVTWSDPTVTPSRLAISSRLSPSATSSLIFSIACGVNLTRLPLADELAFVIVMAAPFGSRPVVVANRYSLSRSLNHTHDHRLTLDSPPNSGVARLACFIDSRAKNLCRCVRLPPYTPASLSVVYSRIFRRASGGSSGDNNMRLMTAADRPEPLWLALRMVQVVLRASPSAPDCWSRVTNPASMRDCPSSRIFATCRDFISVTTNVPFRWDERWALRIGTLAVTDKLV